MSEAPACAQSDDHLSAFPEKCPGLLKSFIGMSYKLLLGSACKRSMMAERADARVTGTDLYAIFRSENSVSKQHAHTLQDGKRIVKCSERIHAHVKSEVPELSSDVVGKAATEHHYLVII